LDLNLLKTTKTTAQNDHEEARERKWNKAITNSTPETKSINNGWK